MCVKVTAETFFQKNRTEEKDATFENQCNENNNDLTVSGDGARKERGYSSLYGVTSLIAYYPG